MLSMAEQSRPCERGCPQRFAIDGPVSKQAYTLAYEEVFILIAVCVRGNDRVTCIWAAHDDSLTRIRLNLSIDSN
jgi:hypothetical protein